MPADPPGRVVKRGLASRRSSTTSSTTGAPVGKRRTRCSWGRNDNVSATWYWVRSVMSTAPKRQAQRRETLNIRIRAEQRGLIDRAAQARGKNRTDFILDAA